MEARSLQILKLHWLKPTLPLETLFRVRIRGLDRVHAHSLSR